MVVEDFDPHAQGAGLNLTVPYRADRVTTDEAADDVGAPRNRCEVNILLDLLVDEIEAFRGER